MSEELKELQVRQLNKTIGKILDELDRAKEAYMAINADNFLEPEVANVLLVFNTSILPSITIMANNAEQLNAASLSDEEPLV